MHVQVPITSDYCTMIIVIVRHLELLYKPLFTTNVHQRCVHTLIKTYIDKTLCAPEQLHIPVCEHIT